MNIKELFGRNGDYLDKVLNWDIPALQTGSLWFVTFDPCTPVVGADIPDDLELVMTGITFPQQGVDYEVTDFGAVYMKGKKDISEVTITFADDLEGTYTKAMHEWLDGIIDYNTGRVKLNWRQKGVDIHIYLYQLIGNSEDAEVKLSQEYKINSAYIDDIADISLSTEDGGYKEFAISCVCNGID